MSERPTAAVQDYLKAIHSLGGVDRGVLPVHIADKLGVRAPSVTGMLKRLAELGWITYTPDNRNRKGKARRAAARQRRPARRARLTEQGVAEARSVIRRHRLLELFLQRVLGLDWSEVDEEADALEHAISPRLEQAIAAYLNEPQEDPHGHLIPTAAGELTHRELRSLDQFRDGQRVVIREVQDDNPARLRRWQSQGLTPGAVVRVLSYQPLDDLFVLEVGNNVVTLGSEALTGIRGEEITASPG